MLIIGGLIITVNILFGVLLSAYSPYNMWFNTAMIAITTIMLYLVQSVHLKDAFKVSLTILLPISGFLKFLLGLFAPSRFEDNWCVIVCTLITVFEIIVLLAVLKTSKYV